MNKFSSLSAYFQRLTLSSICKVSSLEHWTRRCTEVPSHSKTSISRAFSWGSAIQSDTTGKPVESFGVTRQAVSAIIPLQKSTSDRIRGTQGLHFSTSGPVVHGNSVTCSHVITGLLQKGTCDQNVQLVAQRGMASLQQMHRTGPHIKKRKKRRPLDGKPFMKGVVLKTLIKKPKKPNSANRKCVLLKLSNGKEAVAHVPGEGHNLQEHHIVLVRVGRLKDVPGVKLKVVRGKYDCAHVVKKTQAK